MGVAPAFPAPTRENRRFDPRAEHADPIPGPQPGGESCATAGRPISTRAASLRPQLRCGQGPFRRRGGVRFPCGRSRSPTTLRLATAGADPGEVMTEDSRSNAPTRP